MVWPGPTGPGRKRNQFFGVANGDPLKLSMSVLIRNGIPAFDCAWCRCIQATSIFGAASEMLDSETIPCFVE